MATPTDWYQVGAGPLNGLVEGQQIALDRARQAQEARTRDLRNTQLEGQVADEAATRDRTNQRFQDLSNLYPRSTPMPGQQPVAPQAPTGGLPMPDQAPTGTEGGPPSAGAPPVGAAGPAPTGQGMPSPQGAAPATGGGLPTPQSLPAAAGQGATIPVSITPNGDRLRSMAGIAGRNGDMEVGRKYEADARLADVKDIFAHGASIAKDPAKLDAAIRMVTAKDPAITIYKVDGAKGDKEGRYRMTVNSPDGTVYPKDLNATQIATLMGAQALMEHHFVDEALDKFKGISAELATEVAVRNKAQTGAAEFNNKGIHDQSDDESKRITAEAHRTSAQASAERVNMDKRMAKITKLDTTIGDDGNPVVNLAVEKPDGTTEIKQIKFPPGTRLQKQIDPARIEARASALMGTPVTGDDGAPVLDKSGKPRVYDASSSYDAAVKQVAGSDSHGAPNPGAGKGISVPAGVTPQQAAAAAGGGKKKPEGLPMPAARPNGPDGKARGAAGKLAQMTDRELAEIPAGNSAYQAAQEELQIRQEERADQTRGSGSFDQQ